MKLNQLSESSLRLYAEIIIMVEQGILKQFYLDDAHSAISKRRKDKVLNWDLYRIWGSGYRQIQYFQTFGFPESLASCLYKTTSYQEIQEIVNQRAEEIKKSF